MKRDPHLRGLYAGAAPRRTATELRTPMLIAAGLIGVPLAIGLAHHVTESGAGAAPPAPPTVDANTTYPMNHFLPGAGYYHAPFHGWFPMPFNFHDPARGWFRGGQWRPTPQEDDAEKREEPRASGFRSSGGASGGRVITSRPTPDAVQRANTGAAAHHRANVIRGGFGASSRPGIS